MKRKLLLVVLSLASLVALTGCEKKDNKNEDTTTTQAGTTQLSCIVNRDGNSSKYIVSYDEGKIKKQL